MNGAKGYLSESIAPDMSEKISQSERMSLATSDKRARSSEPMMGSFAVAVAIGTRITNRVDNGASKGFEMIETSDISPNTSHIMIHINILHINVRSIPRRSFFKKDFKNPLALRLSLLLNLAESGEYTAIIPRVARKESQRPTSVTELGERRMIRDTDEKSALRESCS